VPENLEVAQSSAALPLAEALNTGGEGAVRREDGPIAEKASEGAYAAPGAAPIPMSTSPDATSPDATAPASGISGPPTAELNELVEHGDAFLSTGDVASARLFYERAADAGDGRAALRLGATFDPVFLGRLNSKVQADAAVARSWYSRALDLGAVEAKRQLNSLEVRQRK
jgi:TPR repeat protein